MRARMYGTIQGEMVSNIYYGAYSGQFAAFSLYVDQGFNNKVHRTNILNADVLEVGVGTCFHTTSHVQIVVAVYASGYRLNYNGNNQLERMTKIK
jgi:uncharacterized protein YkwD